jgi:uncharacterized protein YegL
VKRFAALLLGLLIILASAPALAATYLPDEFAVLELGLDDLPRASLFLHAPAALSAENLAVREDGRPALGLGLVRVEPRQSPLAVALVLDDSGSMAGQALDAAKEAACAALAVFPPAAEVGLFPLNGPSGGIFSAASGEAARALEGITAGGNTPLLDALVRAASWVSTRPGQRVVLLFTDGRENASAAREEDAARTLIRSRAVFLALGYAGAEGTDAALLSRLASATGGQYVEAAGPAEFKGLLSWLAARSLAAYRLDLLLPDVSPGYHLLRLEVRVSGRTYAAERGFWITAPGGAGSLPGLEIVEAPPPSWWERLFAPRESAFFAQLYALPVAGRLLAFLGELFLGVGEGGRWSWASVGLSLLFALLALATLGGGAAARAGLTPLAGALLRRRFATGLLGFTGNLGPLVGLLGQLFDVLSGYFGRLAAPAARAVLPRLVPGASAAELAGVTRTLEAVGRAWDLSLATYRALRGGVSDAVSLAGEASAAAEESADLPWPLRRAAGRVGAALEPVRRLETLARLRDKLVDTLRQIFGKE